MTLRPELIAERIRKLREVVRTLRELATDDTAAFLASTKEQWAAERGLQLAAECLFDLGNHLLAARFNAHATTYEDVPERLNTQGVISDELRERLRGLGGFRNLLVRDYLRVDPARVATYLREELGVFDEFADQLERFVAEAG